MIIYRENGADLTYTRAGLYLLWKQNGAASFKWNLKMVMELSIAVGLHGLEFCSRSPVNSLTSASEWYKLICL